MAPANTRSLKCGSCCKELPQNETQIKCDGVCGLSFHTPCSNLGRSESKLLLETSSIRWYCGNCEMNMADMCSLFKTIQKSIDELRTVVYNQSNIISEQTKKISDLESLCSKPNHTISKIIEKKKAEETSRERNLNLSDRNNFTHQTEKEKDRIANTSSSKKYAKTQLVGEKHESVKSGVNEKVTEGNDFTAVEYKNKSKHKQIYIEGTGDNSTVRASTRNAWFFVTRLDKDTTENEIVSMLKDINITADCTKLDLKSKGDFSSFRIGVPFTDKDRIYDGNVWHWGALLKRYYFPRRSTKEAEASENFLDGTIVTPNSI